MLLYNYNDNFSAPVYKVSEYSEFRRTWISGLESVIKHWIAETGCIVSRDFRRREIDPSIPRLEEEAR